MIKDAYGNTRFFGVYRGVVVTATSDGILTLKVPQVLSDQVTGPAFPVATVSGKIPASGQGVWVVFEGGDPSYPLWIGKFIPDTQAVLAALASSSTTSISGTPEPSAIRWSPLFQATGLTFTGTNGTYPTYESHYVRYGQLVTFNIKVKLTTVTNFGTGQFKVDLPFEPIPTAANHFSAWAWVDPSQPADELNGHIQLVADHIPGSQTLGLHWLKETTASPKPVIESLLVQGTPVTFTTASEMYVNGTYICKP